MEDEKYFVRLDGVAFQAVYAEIEAAIEKQTDERHKAGLQNALIALQCADQEHVCTDDMF